jgi:hypothetical protein
MNLSRESFEPRYEQDHFSYEKQSRAQTLWKGIYCSKSNNRWGANIPEMKILGWKLPYDLPLAEKVLPAKFHCIWSYRVQIHK